MKEYKRDKRVLIPRDEFEEEAGEGLGGLGRDEAEADLLELRARMERRLRRPRAIWLPAAAAVVIMLVASALLVTMLRDRPGPGSDMALAEIAITDTAYIAKAEPLEKQGVEVPSPVTAGKAALQTREAKYNPLAGVIENEIAGLAVADEIIVAEEQMAEEETDYVVYAMVEEEMLDEVVVVQAVPQMTRAAMKARAETSDRAAVQETGIKKDIAAVEAAAKKEAAAVGVAAEGRKDSAAAPGAVAPDSPASPEGDWEKYREWVTQNIRYPEGITPIVRQEVMVSFTVRADSTLTDMKVIRTPGEPFTREVFRLLREGPKWVPSHISGNDAGDEVVLMFVFK
ncbi:MAG: hypothetical protein AB9888_03650 [Bacteroidales bacterium]